MEQATKFELVIKPKAAKALGLTILQSLLLRANDNSGDRANFERGRTKTERRRARARKGVTR